MITIRFLEDCNLDQNFKKDDIHYVSGSVINALMRQNCKFEIVGRDVHNYSVIPKFYPRLETK